MQNIVIDNEFKSLIPKISDDEYRLLEESILAEGCRDALIVWLYDAQLLIIDGHNRYEICTKHDLPYDVKTTFFDSREDAKIWIIKNQFARRNLSLFQRSEMAIQLVNIMKPILQAKAKANQTLAGRDRKSDEYKSLPQNSAEAIEPIETRVAVAKIAGISHDTIARVEKINIEGTPDQIERLRNNKASINEVYKEIQKPHVTYGTGDNEWYTCEEIIENARRVLGNIDLDPASSIIANTVVKAEEIFTIEIDGLKQEWHGNIWLNPPYSVSENPKFIDKLVSEYNLGHTKTALVLVNNATETKWFEQLISIASAICFPIGRLKFWSQQEKGSTPLQGQAVVYIGKDIDLFIKEFTNQGWCAIIQHGKHI